MPTEPSNDPADAIAAALARLRGRRMPRPPWAAEHGPHHHHGDPGWGHGRRGHGESGQGDDAGASGFPGMSGMPGMPPWGGGPRLGGPARFRLLESLAAASAPLSVSELAAAIGVDQPRASRLVQQAADMGLVRREADPEDARRTRIALTEKGTAIVRGFRGERRDAIGSALGTFNDDERAELARLLTKLADAWPQA